MGSRTVKTELKVKLDLDLRLKSHPAREEEDALFAEKKKRGRNDGGQPTPLDDDDLLSEILLRLPPQPSSLPRASAVCKRWRQLVSDPRFIRRFRLHHRGNPPLLGFFESYCGLTFEPTLDAPNRVPLRGFSSQRDCDDSDRFISLGCRHGLVLMWHPKRNQVLVWDPVTRDHHRIALPQPFHTKDTRINGAVLRPTGDDHHFQVVLVVAGNEDELPRRVLACVYSSETGIWGNLISTPISPFSRKPSLTEILYGLSTNVLSCMPAVLVGDSLYWTLVGHYAGILEFDLERQTLAVIQVPDRMIEDRMIEEGDELTVMRAKGGGLGFLFASKSDFNAQLWKLNKDCNAVASWVLGKTIELDKLFCPKSWVEKDSLSILGFAEYNNVVLLWTHTGLFMVELESLQFKKLPQPEILSGQHPFESVYAAGNSTPLHSYDAETGIGGGHNVAEL